MPRPRRFRRCKIEATVSCYGTPVRTRREARLRFSLVNVPGDIAELQLSVSRLRDWKFCCRAFLIIVNNLSCGRVPYCQRRQVLVLSFLFILFISFIIRPKLGYKQ